MQSGKAWRGWAGAEDERARMRQPGQMGGHTWKSSGDPLASISSEATSLQRGFSVLSSTGTPFAMPCSLRSLQRCRE